MLEEGVVLEYGLTSKGEDSGSITHVNKTFHSRHSCPVFAVSQFTKRRILKNCSRSCVLLQELELNPNPKSF